VNSLKAKLAVVLFALAILAAIPTQLHADGNPVPTCDPKTGVCVPPGN
jgi:hypothetical protein